MSTVIAMSLASADGCTVSSAPRDDLAGVDERAIEAELAGHDARHVQQLVDEPCLALGVVEDRLAGGRPSRLRQDARAEHVGPSENRVERRAQLVRDRCEELVLQAVGRFGAGAGGALPLEQLDARCLEALHFVEQPLGLRPVALLILEPRDKQQIRAIGQIDGREEQHGLPVLAAVDDHRGERAGAARHHEARGAPERTPRARRARATGRSRARSRRPRARC